MALIGHRFPTEHRSERRFSKAGGLVKASEQLNVRDDVSNLESAKIMVRHELEMGLDSFLVIRPETCLNQSFARFPRSFGALIKRMPVCEVLGGSVIQLPNQRFLPIGPVLVACALAIG